MLIRIPQLKNADRDTKKQLFPNLVLSAAGVPEAGAEPRELGLLLRLRAQQPEEGVVLHTDLPHPLCCSANQTFTFIYYSADVRDEAKRNTW